MHRFSWLLVTKRVFCLVGLGLATAMPARASDYGCKVLLCLANPAGPTAVSQCVPPITQLWRDLASFHPFPTCDEASTPDGRAWAEQGTSYYDVCPSGTTALASGALAAQGTYQGSYSTGIGSGDDLMPSEGQDTAPLPNKVCVGQHTADVSIQIGSGDSLSFVTVGIYDRVVVLDPQGSPRIIDVYVNGDLYRRVRW